MIDKSRNAFSQSNNIHHIRPKTLRHLFIIGISYYGYIQIESSSFAGHSKDEKNPYIWLSQNAWGLRLKGNKRFHFKTVHSAKDRVTWWLIREHNQGLQRMFTARTQRWIRLNSLGLEWTFKHAQNWQNPFRFSICSLRRIYWSCTNCWTLTYQLKADLSKSRKTVDIRRWQLFFTFDKDYTNISFMTNLYYLNSNLT